MFLLHVDVCSDRLWAGLGVSGRIFWVGHRWPIWNLTLASSKKIYLRPSWKCSWVYLIKAKPLLNHIVHVYFLNSFPFWIKWKSDVINTVNKNAFEMSIHIETAKTFLEANCNENQQSTIQFNVKISALAHFKPKPKPIFGHWISKRLYLKETLFNWCFSITLMSVS